MKTSKLSVLLSTIIVSFSVLTPLQSMELPDNLDSFLQTYGANSFEILKRWKTENSGNARKICLDVNSDQTFMDKAKNAGMGTIKAAAMGRYCGGDVEEQAKIGVISQKPKAQESGRETVNLRPIEWGNLDKNQTIQEQNANLEAVQKQVMNNAEILKKDPRFESQMIDLMKQSEQIQEIVKENQEYYDNLSVAVMIMREDMKTDYPGLKNFNSKNHDEDSAEVFISEFYQFLQQNPGAGGYPQGATAQVKSANELLVQARSNYEKGRQELIRINREMMDLVGK